MSAISQVCDFAPSSRSLPFDARGRRPPPNQPLVRGGAAELAVYDFLAALAPPGPTRLPPPRPARCSFTSPRRRTFIRAVTVLLCLARSTWRPARPHRCDSPAPPRAALAHLRTSIVRPSQRSPTPGSRTLATHRSCGPSRLFAAPCGPPPGSLTTTVAWCDPRRCEARPAGLSDDRGRTTPKNHPCCCPPRGPSAQY